MGSTIYICVLLFIYGCYVQWYFFIMSEQGFLLKVYIVIIVVHTLIAVSIYAHKVLISYKAQFCLHVIILVRIYSTSLWLCLCSVGGDDFLVVHARDDFAAIHGSTPYTHSSPGTPINMPWLGGVQTGRGASVVRPQFVCNDTTWAICSTPPSLIKWPHELFCMFSAINCKLLILYMGDSRSPKKMTLHPGS